MCEVSMPVASMSNTLIVQHQRVPDSRDISIYERLGIAGMVLLFIDPKDALKLPTGRWVQLDQHR